MDSVMGGVVALLFFASAAYAASIGIGAIRTRTYVPKFGTEMHGRGAVVAGFVAILVAMMFLTAGVFASFVTLRG